jgi:hypothetical protein
MGNPKRFEVIAKTKATAMAAAAPAESTVAARGR